MNSSTNLTIVTLNTNGIKNKIEEIINYFYKQNIDILLLQETHLAEEDEPFISNTFTKKKIETIFSSRTIEKMKRDFVEKKKNKINANKEIGTVLKEKEINNINPNAYKKSGGLGILYKHTLSPFIELIKKGERYIEIKITNGKSVTHLINIYAPTGNHTTTNNFIEKELGDLITQTKKKTNNIIVGGDFNATIDSVKDRWSNFAISTNSVTFEGLNNLIKAHNLVDIWRKKNPEKIEFSWERNKMENKEKNKERSENLAMRLDFFLTTPKIGNSKLNKAYIPEKKPIDSDHKPVVLIIGDTEIKQIEIPDPIVEITKINQKNRDKNTKEKFIKWFQNNDLTHLHNNLQQIQTKFDPTLFDQTVEEINVIWLKACEEIYGIKNNIKTSNINNNKEIGLLKRKVKKIENLLNFYWNCVRNNMWDQDKINHLGKKTEDFYLPNFEKGNNNHVNHYRNARKKIKKEIRNKISKIEREDIQKAIENLIESQETNPKRFYEKMNNKEKSTKKSIKCVKNEEKGIIKLLWDPSEVKNKIKEFWQILFSSKKISPPYPLLVRESVETSMGQ